jgi:hypothetical protein
VAAQHGELMPQHRDLGIRIRSRTAADHAEDPPQDKECQGLHHHGSRSCQPASPLLTGAR